jgi:hypothetical protein
MTIMILFPKKIILCTLPQVPSESLQKCLEYFLVAKLRANLKINQSKTTLKQRFFKEEVNCIVLHSRESACATENPVCTVCIAR